MESTYQSVISDLTTGDNPGGLKGKLLIGLETVHPGTEDTVAGLLGPNGADLVACPVLGPPAAAAAGELIAFPAGPGRTSQPAAAPSPAPPSRSQVSPAAWGPG